MNGNDTYERTPLMIAASCGDVDRFRLLLNTAMTDDAHGEDNGVSEALVLAAENGQVECVRCLLEAVTVAGVTVLEGNHIFRRALVKAAEGGHIDCIKCLLATGLVQADDGDKYWTTALESAVKNGHVACVKYLLEAVSVEVNGNDEDISIAVMIAAENGHISCLNCLLDTGFVNVNDGDFHGSTALMLAVMHGHVGCVKYLLETGLVDVKRKDREGSTAFLLAAENGQVSCLEALLDTGLVDVNQATNSGSTALMLGVGNGHVDCVKYLLETGLVNVNKRDKNGRTACMLAASAGRVGCLRCLLQTNLVDVNKAGRHGWTALMLAARNGHADCLKCLLDSGLVDDINRKGEYGLTALMTAAKNGRTECVRQLLDTGLIDDLHAKDQWGNTAFTSAARRAHIDCLRCFLDIVVTDEIPTTRDANQDVGSSASLFTPNDSVTWFTYAPGIRWRPPYVYDRDQQTQSTLKLVVGRGRGRCVVCFLLGNLDVPLAPNSACHHEGLERSTVKAIKVCRSREVYRREHFEAYADYMLQYERIRFHALTLLLREQLARTHQIPLHLYKALCSLIWDSTEVEMFLRHVFDGSHPARCTDMLLSALVCQEDKGDEASWIGDCFYYGKWKVIGMLLQHVLLQDCHPMPYTVYSAFTRIESRCFSSRPAVHEEAATFREIYQSCLRNGVFEWSLYPQVCSEEHLLRGLVNYGYSPGEFGWMGGSFSPLRRALSKGDEGLIRYIVANLYLTPTDMEQLHITTVLAQRINRNCPESLLRLYRQIGDSPWSLRALSFVKISAPLKCKRRRKNKSYVSLIDSLPIPESFKRLLSFDSPVGKTPINEWDFIDIRPYI